MAEENTTEVTPNAALDALMAEGEAIEGLVAAQAEQREEAQEAASIESVAAELFAALEMARMMVGPMMGWWPEFGQVWGDRTLQGIATSGAAVMQRQGWTLGEFMGQYGPYIALAGATLPPSLATWQAIKIQKLRVQQRQEAKRDERPQQAAD